MIFTVMRHINQIYTFYLTNMLYALCLNYKSKTYLPLRIYLNANSPQDGRYFPGFHGTAPAKKLNKPIIVLVNISARSTWQADWSDVL